MEFINSKKNTSGWKIFFFAKTITKNTATCRSCANLKVVVFFISETSSRGT